MKTQYKLIPVSVLVFYSTMASFNFASAALDEFTPYAYAGALYDSNIFRISDGEEVNTSESKDDTITHLGVGLTSDLKISRQHILFDINLDRASYDNNDQLDHTAIEGDLVWAWLLGNLWNGNIGYDYRKELSSFDESELRVKDMRTISRTYLDAGYQLLPDWRLQGGISQSDTTYDVRSRLDRKTNTVQAEMLYRNTLNSKVGVRYRHANHDLKRDINDYEENEVSGVIYWEGSAKSSLEARMGYIDLSYDQAEDRDFQGFSAKMIYNWILTGKTKVDFSIWRETSSKNDEITSYVLSKGVSIRPIWSATKLISIVGEVLYEQDDFIGDEALISDERTDDIQQFQIRANWDPRRYIRVSLGYRYKNRDSNYDSRDFEYDQVDLRARITF